MMSGDSYHDHVSDMLSRLQEIVSSKWPETLNGDGNAYSFARENHPELMTRYDEQEAELNGLWLNRASMDDFKQLCTSWGKTILEIHQVHAAALKRQEAA